MTNDELRALADALEFGPLDSRFTPPLLARKRAADYLRAQADVQPVAWQYRWKGSRELHYTLFDPTERDTQEIIDVQPLYSAPAASQAGPKREPLSEEQMRAVLIAEARRIAVQAGEKDPDSLTLDEEMLAQVMLAGRAVERAHGIGGSDEC